MLNPCPFLVKPADDLVLVLLELVAVVCLVAVLLAVLLAIVLLVLALVFLIVFLIHFSSLLAIDSLRRPARNMFGKSCGSRRLDYSAMTSDPGFSVGAVISLANFPAAGQIPECREIFSCEKKQHKISRNFWISMFSGDSPFAGIGFTFFPHCTTIGTVF